MERRSAENIGTVLSRFLRQEGLETPLAQHRAIEAWPEVVGQAAAAVTESVDVRGQTMLVRLLSPIVRHELLMRRDEIIRQLNAKAGMNLIYELRLV